jgi:hypothetical protein
MALRSGFMASVHARLPTLIEARQAAGRRCVSLVVSAAMSKFATRTVSEAQLAEVEAAKTEWEATAQAVADQMD